jgi:prevent-host-death family protein
MDSVGAFEAKTHLPALLERVAKGETIQITRRGIPVARLVPAGASALLDRRRLAAEIREMRKGVRLGRTSIRELINRGRRY